MYLHEWQTANKTHQSQKYIRTDTPHPQNSKSMELCFSRSLLLTEPTVTDKLKGITESLKSVDLGKKNLTDEDEILYGHKTQEATWLKHCLSLYKYLQCAFNGKRQKEKVLYNKSDISQALKVFSL